jgi:triosephosphate isomerase (TIM)
MRTPFIGGNWKCNGTKDTIKNLVNTFNQSNRDYSSIDVICAPTALHLDYVKQNLRKDFKVGIQNIWGDIESGAYTGEITANIAKDFGIEWVIVGHSERRHLVSKESDIILFDKAVVALHLDLNIIFCIGESLKEREENRTFEVCLKQLQLLVDNLSFKSWKNIVIAYEPVWAIGTGKNATPEQVEEVHSFLRKYLIENIDYQIANSIRIIYGGSVKPSNATELYQQPNIDGFLVGGSSLKEDFLEIIECTL